ncbi:protein-arginine deiminase family protein [Thermopirellula anaerolimosa]
MLFWDYGRWGPWYPGVLLFANNVVNSLVDGDTLFVAHVHGPTVSQGWFNDYVQAAAGLVGFMNVLSCEERTYHNGAGSIHCGTNVLREIPADRWWDHS